MPFQPQKYWFWLEPAEPVTRTHRTDCRPRPHSQLLDCAVKVTFTVLVWNDNLLADLAGPPSPSLGDVP